MTSSSDAAAIGVAFTAASFALGISLGMLFPSSTGNVDLLSIARSQRPDTVPRDVRDEVFYGIEDEDRPRKGDWILITGGTLAR